MTTDGSVHNEIANNDHHSKGENGKSYLPEKYALWQQFFHKGKE
jgi:hypothetical protein